MIPPSQIIKLKNFSANPVPIGELLTNGWNDQLVALLGPFVFRNPQGKRFYSITDLETKLETEPFQTELVKLVDQELQTLGGRLPYDLTLLAEACEALFNTNKFIKAKLFSASPIKKLYELKALFIKYLWEQGYATSVLFETDTKQYRFTFVVADKTYIWHQPIGTAKYAGQCPTVVSSPQTDRPTTTTDHEAARLFFTRAMFSIVREQMS